MLEKPELFTLSTVNAKDNSVKDIDDVFIKITKIYSVQEFLVIYNTLLLMEKDPEQYETYINGLTALMQPRNNLIKKWINDNIVY